MAEDPQLCLPRDDQIFKIDTDASDGAVGAVLYQDIDGERRVISYFSKVLNKQQRNWSVTDKELFAILEAVRHFPYEAAKGVIIYTDHQPLIALQKSKTVKGKVASRATSMKIGTMAKLSVWLQTSPLLHCSP